MSFKSPDDLPTVEKTRKVQKLYKDYAPFLTLGFQLAVGVVLFFLIGHWADKYFNVEPAGKLVGVILGSIGGFIKFFKTVKTLSDKESKK